MRLEPCGRGARAKQREENGVQSRPGELSADEIAQSSRVEDGHIRVRLPDGVADRRHSGSGTTISPHHQRGDECHDFSELPEGQVYRSASLPGYAEHEFVARRLRSRYQAIALLVHSPSRPERCRFGRSCRTSGR